MEDGGQGALQPQGPVPIPLSLLGGAAGSQLADDFSSFCESRSDRWALGRGRDEEGVSA